MDLSLINTIFAIFFLCSIAHLLSNKFRRGLSDIPGPALAGFSRLWRVWDVSSGQVMNSDIELHQRYGPIIRTGPRHVLVSDTDAIKLIYSPSGGFTKTQFYYVQSPVLDGRVHPRTLFNLQNETEHAQLKRAVATAYSLNNLKVMEPLVDEISDLFLNITEKFAQTGQPMDLGEWIQWYAFDVIGNLTFSKPFGFLERGEDVEKAISQINAFLYYGSIVGQIPELHYILLGNPILLKLLNSSHPTIQFTERSIKEREENKFVAKSAPDFLTSFRKIHNEKPDHFSSQDIFLSAAANVFAGSDTTAISFRAVIHQLLTHSDCLAKLRDEIDRCEREGRISERITFNEANNMPYLQACIKESLRLHPAVGMCLERYVPRGGAVICGRHLPEGTIVGANPWVAGRDPAVYGKDALEFKPERWIEAEEEQLRVMERNFLVFGAGARICTVSTGI